MIFTQTIPLTSLSLKLRRRKTTILIISGSLTRNRKTLRGGSFRVWFPSLLKTKEPRRNLETRNRTGIWPSIECLWLV